MPSLRGLGRSWGVTAVDGLRTGCGVSSDGGGRWARAAKRARNDCRSFLGSGCGGVRTGIGEGGAARAWGSSRTGVRTAGDVYFVGDDAKMPNDYVETRFQSNRYASSRHFPSRATRRIAMKKTDAFAFVPRARTDAPPTPTRNNKFTTTKIAS